MMNSESTANEAICSESKPASSMDMIIQWLEEGTRWFQEGIAGAQPLESLEEMHREAMEQCRKMADTDVADDDRYSNIEESKYSRYVCLDSLATKQSVFIDSIPLVAHSYILFAVVHVLYCVNHAPLFQVFLLIFLKILLFLYWYINYAPFLFLEEDYKWIRRESRLLSAILEDVAEVKRLCSQIGTRADPIWDSNLEEAVAGQDKIAQEEWVCKSVAVAGLDHNQSKWVDETRSFVPEAQSLVKSFEEMRDSHRIRIFLGLTKKNFMQTGVLFIKSRQVRKEVDHIVMKKEYGINICKSLERLRSNARRLQERPLEHGERSVNSGGLVASAADLASSTVEKINNLISQNPDLMQESSSTGEQIKSLSLQLQLLHPFLKDIQGLDRFESAIEQAWVEEVVELIDEAHLAIENFLKKPSYRIRWLSFISRRKVKGDIRCINFGFTQVLERKDRYGFKFTRDSSKVMFQSPDQTTGDSIVSSVVGKVQNCLKENSDVLGELSSEVELLFNQLESMSNHVGDAGMLRTGYNSRIAWLDQGKKIVDSVHEFVILCTEMKFETKAGINQINHTISLFLRCIKAFSIELRENTSLVVGLEEQIEEVVSRLRTNNEHCSVTSVFGIEGIGKTVLAKKVYNHGKVVEHFDCRAWVSLPHDYSYNNEQLLLEDVAKQVFRSFKSETHPEINPNASRLIHKAHDILKEKRYLLVLDNISTKEKWDALKAAFPVSTSRGSRILVTTREHNVALKAGGDIHPPLQLERLTKEESLQLFSQVVYIPPEGKMLVKAILSKCEGIPLAIIRLLSGKDEATAQELKRVIQHCKQNDTSSLNDYTKNCIINLPSALSNCLSCFKLFPKDYKIPVRRLFALWIAEGFAKVREHTTGTHKSDSKNRRKTSGDSGDSGDSVDERLSALIDWDIVQVVEKKLNGKVRTCRLNKDVEEVVRSETMMSDKRLADHAKRGDPSFEYIHRENPNFPDSYNGLFSILSFDHQEGYKPGADIGNFLRRGIASGFFLQLKFLDLERVFRPELPSTIGKLSKLRYLGLRWTCLESIPPSIGELVNLETLDLKHTYVHTLPSSIWKLHKLRHLYLSQRYRSKLSCHQGRSSLKNLWTLWGVFVDKHSPLKDGLDKISNLRKLGLAFHLEKEEQKPLKESIGKLNHLQSLRMRSIGEMGEPRLLVLESLLGLENLSSLNLFGVLEKPVLEKPSIIAGFPRNLTDLTLSASSFEDDPMHELGKLSNLQSLCLYSNSYTGKEMVCHTWGFEKLLILKLWKLEQLEDWVVEEKAMQNLKKLDIRSCVKLKVPTGMRHLKRLKELKLTNMPEAFCAAMDKTNVEVWGDIAQSPDITRDSW